MEKPKSEAEHPIVEFEIKEQSRQQAGGTATGPRRVSKIVIGGKIAKNWLPQIRAKGANQGSARGTSDTLAKDDHLTDSYFYQEGSSQWLGENKNWEFLKYLYTKIDREIYFDPLLIQYGHFGIVFVEFRVFVDGALISDSIRVSAEDPILKVHSLRGIRAATREPFPKTKWNGLAKKLWSE